MATVVLLGTMDTKGEEYEFARRLLEKEGCDVITVDVGIKGEPRMRPDITREQVAEAAGCKLVALAEKNDRGYAIGRMSEGAARVVCTLHQENRLQGIFALGGSGGSSIAAFAMRALPIGVPKLLVSTIASGDTSAYVGQTDITMMYSVVDIAGINAISERILSNAAAAIAAMAQAAERFVPRKKTRPLVAVTMFGVTTPCVTAARRRLEDLGYETIVFHANGSGGKAMESLIRNGYFSGVLDVTTTELADEVAGGLLTAGADRLEIAGRTGIPQVVSLGALDMVNFGPVETVPERYRNRKLYRHNPNVTLMRTTAEECRRLGKMIGCKLNESKGPTAVFVPMKGFSLISEKNEIFHDPDADKALIDSLMGTLKPHVQLVVLDTAINDPFFAEAMADAMHAFIQRSEVRPI